MLSKIKFWAQIFKRTYRRWYQKDPFRQSAVIAYYAIFSIPALLVLVIAIAGYFFEKEVVNQNILHQISQTMGTETATEVESMLSKAGQLKPSLLGSVISIITLLLGATGVFIELQKTLNIIWKIKVIPKKGIWLFLRARLFSFGLILAIAFLLLISLVLSSLLTAFSDWIQAHSSEVMTTSLNIINLCLSVVIISFLFGLIFKVLPDAKIDWKHVWRGALLTGVLFTIGKTGLAFYFGKAEPASVYGAAGSVILILLWVSYSSMIMFFGAEFTAIYTEMSIGKVQPSEIATSKENTTTAA